MVPLAQPFPALAGSGPASAPRGRDPLRETAAGFEQMYLSALLSPVFEELADSQEFGGGSAEATWSTLLAGEYAGAIARSGGLGVADIVYRELLSLQEGASQ